MEAGHFDSVVYLRLWSGDLEGALQLATERGELNDHLLSIAPMGTCVLLAQCCFSDAPLDDMYTVQLSSSDVCTQTWLHKD